MGCLLGSLLPLNLFFVEAPDTAGGGLCGETDIPALAVGVVVVGRVRG